MKISHIVLSTGLVLAASQSVFALTTGEKTIDLQADVPELLELVGTAVNSSTDIIISHDGYQTTTPTTPLGTLGLRSNLLGACKITFVSDNNYTLAKSSADPVDPSLVLTTYKLVYQGIDVASNIRTGLPCNNTLITDTNNALEYVPVTATTGLVAPGVYSDVVTLTATNE